MDARQTTRVWRARREFTLLELVVSLATTSIILLGAVGTLALAARALPASDDPATTTRALAETVEAINADATVAVGFATNTDTAILLPDADDDGKEELARYVVVDGTLCRVYNDGDPVGLLPNAAKIEMSAGILNDAAVLTTTITTRFGGSYQTTAVCVNFEAKGP